MPKKITRTEMETAEIKAVDEAEKKETVAEETVKAEPEKKPARRKRTAKKTAEKADAAAAEKSETAAETEKAEAEAVAEKKPARRKRTTKKAAEKSETAAETEKADAEAAAEKKPARRKRTTKKTAEKAEAAATEKSETAAETEKADAEAAAEKKPVRRKRTTKKTAEKSETAAETEITPAAEIETPAAETETPAAETETPAAEPEEHHFPESEEKPVEVQGPRRSIAFIGSECHPFVKTGGLGDVMYALPRSLKDMNCDVRVILPRYECIPQKYQDKMVYRGAFYMDFGETGREYYVGIMEYVWDGVVYDFIDNQEFFSGKKPYTNLVDDIPKYCFFSKAALAALNYLNWIPDVIHCHDWQAGLVPVYLRTLFAETPLAHAKTVITIHNLRFQGIYNIPTIKYWTGLPDYVFNKDALVQNWVDANMFKGGLDYADKITTVSATYAKEIQTAEYGENLEAHLQYHAGKLIGIVNGIDYEMWNPATDAALTVNYDVSNALEKKKESKRALQEELGLAQDDGKFVIGLISRLTDQKGLDLVNAIIPQVMDGNTQVVILGTGEKEYEDSFRNYADKYSGSFAACIQYDESRAHRIYAGADALLVPSRFEPCGLTQLNAMHYGTVPIVRETGGLKDTVEPYNMYTNTGNGFTFDRYESGLLLDAVNRAKTFFFTERQGWDEMVQRDMNKDVSWENSAKQYREMYLELTQW